MVNLSKESSASLVNQRDPRASKPSPIKTNTGATADATSITPSTRIRTKVRHQREMVAQGKRRKHLLLNMRYLVAPIRLPSFIAPRLCFAAAPIVQRIEQWFPKPKIEVRVLVGAPASTAETKSVTFVQLSKDYSDGGVPKITLRASEDRVPTKDCHSAKS